MFKDKILTIVGTRPEIIRLSVIIKKLDKYSDHKVLNTLQNHQPEMNSSFFDELGLRQPDYESGFRGKLSLAEYLLFLFKKTETIINSFKPNKVLILGDTNSGLASIICERYNIPVYHMEAGNRCFNLKVPEEKNRKLIDTISTYNLPYVERSRENLLREGFPKERIFMCGNPIKEVLNVYFPKFHYRDVLRKYNLNYKQFILSTLHRAENVDDINYFNDMIHKLWSISQIDKIPIIISTHPRIQDKITKEYENIFFLKPFGFLDFISLEACAKILVTDSGTVPEEGCILNTPSIIFREQTERVELIECGSSILSSLKNLQTSYEIIKNRDNWKLPKGYDTNDTSDKVVQFLLGK